MDEHGFYRSHLFFAVLVAVILGAFNLPLWMHQTAGRPRPARQRSPPNHNTYGPKIEKELERLDGRPRRRVCLRGAPLSPRGGDVPRRRRRAEFARPADRHPGGPRKT